MEIKRGDVIYLKRTEEPSSLRPYVVVSNDVGNRHSMICLAVPLTSKHKNLYMPTHTLVDYNSSMVMAEQIHTFKQEDIERVAHHLSDADMEKVDKCLKASFGGR